MWVETNVLKQSKLSKGNAKKVNSMKVNSTNVNSTNVNGTNVNGTKVNGKKATPVPAALASMDDAYLGDITGDDMSTDSEFEAEIDGNR